MSSQVGRHAFFLTYRTREWVELIQSLINDLALDRNNVRVFDVSLFTSPRQISLTESHLRRLLELPVDVLRPSQDATGNSLPHIEPIDSASFGQMQTYFQDDQPRDSRMLRRQLRKSTSLARNLCLEIHSNCQQLSLECGYVPNGRFPQEVAISMALRDLGAEVTYFEKSGSSPKHYFTANARVHDSSLDSATESTLPRKELRSLQENILIEKGAIEVDSMLEAYGLREDDYALFLSSSTDEIGAFSWLDADSQWTDQYEAFMSIANYLASKGVNSVLRVHPNLQNKSRRMRRREKARLRLLAQSCPSMTIILDWEAHNTHVLISGASYIVTSLSTTGLDASALGKCVWVTMHNSWSRFADVRLILSVADLNPTNMSRWDVDASAAAQRISALRKREREITPLASPSLFGRLLEKLTWVSFLEWSDRILLLRVKLPTGIASAVRGMMRRVRSSSRRRVVHSQA